MQELPVFFPKNRQEWREWLIENHQKEEAIWLGYYRTNTQISTIAYTDAVDEALCFGWIDSKLQPLDQQRYLQYFCKRKPTSVWSKVNKTKVEKLIAEGLMTQAGYKTIEIAKQNGSWTLLDDAENLVLPQPLAQALQQAPLQTYWQNLSRTTQRNLLQWVAIAKKPETKTKRIDQIIEAITNQTLPPNFIPKKS